MTRRARDPCFQMGEPTGAPQQLGGREESQVEHGLPRCVPPLLATQPPVTTASPAPQGPLPPL